MVKKWKLTLSVLINLLLLVAILGLGFVYRDKLYQRYVQVQGEYTIIMYGNSITAQGKWVELLGRTDVLNAALPGQATYHFLESLERQVISKKPKICFIMGGINDITIGVSQKNIQRHYTAILERLLAEGIVPVVSLTLYEQDNAYSRAQVDLLNGFLVQYCEKHSIRYLNPNQYLSDSRGLLARYAVDQTHLNEAAYKLWGAEINRVLQELAI